MMFVVLFLILIILTFSGRVAYVVCRSRENISKPCARTLIVLGSGGHTAEMMRQIVNLDLFLYRPRLYVVADGDSSSKNKIKLVESRFEGQENSNWFVKHIPRSRKVGQPYITTVWTTIYSTITCFPIIFTFKPDVILCNGPGTCVPLCIVAFFMNILSVTNTRIVFIESICRVKTLSLSGKILIRFADKVLVQWMELKQKYPQTEYIGRLV